MKSQIGEIILFTVSACPMGRSMGTVLGEVKKLMPEVQIKSAYVDEETELTNQYRIKGNPTTLIMDKQGNELGRLEGFAETEKVMAYIRMLEEQRDPQRKELDENNESSESYTVYLLREGIPQPVQADYRNLTSVRTPRITAIRLLLKARKQGYFNPFPESSVLELVNFNQPKGRVTIRMREEEGRLADIGQMKMVLVETLRELGVKDVEMAISY